jgi:hypothetical protein
MIAALMGKEGKSHQICSPGARQASVPTPSCAVPADPEGLIGLPEHLEEFLDFGRSRCIAFNPAGTLLASGCEGGEVVVWDCLTRGVARVYQGHRCAVAFPA